jgi:hypothetical protein
VFNQTIPEAPGSDVCDGKPLTQPGQVCYATV